MDKVKFYKPPRCGMGKCQPRFLQVFLNINYFTFFMCVFGIISGMFPMYLVSQVTTIERHFGLPSKKSGMVVGSGEIGYLISIIFVGHFLNTSHRPRVLAICAFVIGLGSFIMTIPYFAFGSPHHHGTSEMNTTSRPDKFCRRNLTFLNDSDGCEDERYGEGFEHADAAFGIFMLGSILYGCGSTGLWSIGIAFLDDNAGKKEAALYIGLMLCFRSIAPVFGLMFGAGVAKVSVDFQDLHLTTDDPTWIGAWWIGFLVIGAVTILCGIPLLFYPKWLPPRDKRKVSITSREVYDSGRRKQSIVERAAEESKTLVKSFPKSVWRLIRNKILLCMLLASMIDIGGSVGYMAFTPKYIENQFNVKPFVANMIVAAIVGAMALANGLSGLLTAKIKMSLNDLFIRMIIAMTICYCAFLGLMAFGCPQLEIAGYDTRSNSTETLFLPNETCQVQCSCPVEPFQPVCGSDVTYFSPCHAGCSSGDKVSGFSGCECVAGGQASTGTCPTDCAMIIPFAICQVVLSFLINVTYMPFVMVLIRCVDEKDKSLALALMNIFVSFGILPVPILYGSLMDGMCVIPNVSVCGSEKNEETCLFYDNDAMRYKLHGVTFGIRGVCPILYALCWYLSRNMVFAGDEDLAKQRNKPDEAELKQLQHPGNEKPKDEDLIVDPEKLKPIISA